MFRLTLFTTARPMNKRPTAPMPSFDTHLQKQSYNLQIHPIKLIWHTKCGSIYNYLLQTIMYINKNIYQWYTRNTTMVVPFGWSRSRSQVKINQIKNRSQWNKDTHKASKGKKKGKKKKKRKITWWQQQKQQQYFLRTNQYQQPASIIGKNNCI